MDIYTAKGYKVRFTGMGGYESEKELANKILEIGKEYTVSGLSVGGYSSRVFLEEFPRQSFNSVMFENVGEYETVEPNQYNNYVRF